MKTTAWLFVAIGVLYYGLGCHVARQNDRALTWPTTSGTITEASIDHATRSYPNDRYFLRVAYDYTVDGTAYSGWRIAFGNWYDQTSQRDRGLRAALWVIGALFKFTSAEYALLSSGEYEHGVALYSFPERIEVLTVGASVVVHYDPESPSVAVIDPSPEWGSGRYKLIGGFLLFSAAAWVGIAVLRAMKPPAPRPGAAS